MSEYKVINNYVIFEELNSDPLGINYRAGEIEERKTSNHRLLTEVYPFIAGSPETWKRVNILMDGIRKSNIPNLYAPVKIIKEEGSPKAFLIYPLIKGRTFEKILEDSMEKDLPINFDLTFSIAIAIADLIDTGSSIVVSGQKSFHGFLTPDNILFDYDGKIYLKNYGIFPYLSKTEELFNEMVSKYGAWVAPEFLRKEKLVPQSDIYHLGYIIYRILTGEYFSYSEGEDFDAKFANIRFSQQLPSGDIDFITNLISFFKQTLNPDPNKRFVNMKEFKDYIAQYFHIEELSSVTFNLAYFMNSLYMGQMDEETEKLKKELTYVLPEPKKDPAAESHLAESILAGLEEQKSSKLKVIIPLIIVIIIVAIVAVFFISQAQKAAREKQQQLQTIKDMETRLADFQKQQEEAQKQYQAQLKTLEAKKATTEEEQRTKEEEIKKLKEWRLQQEKKELERIKSQQEDLKKQQALDDQRKKDFEDAELKRKQEEERKKTEEAAKKLEDERNKVIEGQVIPLSDASEPPVKIKDAEPLFPSFVRDKYKGTKGINILTNIQIDENGQVINVRILGNPPEDLANIISKTLKKYQYKPARKNNVKVKVWMPVSFKIAF
ncbi:MAG: protein kinase [Acidobacteria bacterium]|jgi:serine/threonine protein kinase|nr:protein kinase [Acidobacteriota bacterium]